MSTDGWSDNKELFKSVNLFVDIDRNRENKSNVYYTSYMLFFLGNGIF